MFDIKILKKFSIISISALTLLGVGYSASANNVVAPAHAKIVRHMHKHVRHMRSHKHHITKRSKRHARKYSVRHHAHKNTKRIAIIKSTRHSIKSSMRTVRKTLRHTKSRSGRRGLRAELKEESHSLRAMNRQLRLAEK